MWLCVFFSYINQICDGVGVEGKLTLNCILLQEHRGLLSVKYPMEHGIVKDWNDMERIWQYVYSKEQLQTFSEEVCILECCPICTVVQIVSVNITAMICIQGLLDNVFKSTSLASCAPYWGTTEPQQKPWACSWSVLRDLQRPGPFHLNAGSPQLVSQKKDTDIF